MSTGARTQPERHRIGLPEGALGGSLVLLVVIHAALTPGSTARSWSLVAIKLLVAVAMVVGIGRFRPAAPAVWAALAGGFVLSAIGTAASVPAAIAVGAWLSPTAFVAAYLVFLAAATATSRRGTAASRGRWLDTAVLVAAGSTVVLLTLTLPLLQEARGDSALRVAAVLYPSAHLLLLGVTAHLLLRSWRSVPFRWIVAGLVGLLTSDLLFGVPVLGAAPPGVWDGAVRGLANATFGFAALHPSMRSLAGPAPASSDDASTRTSIALLAAAVVALPLVLLVRLDRWTTPELVVLSLGMATVGSLVLARLWTAMTASAQAHRRRGDDRLHALVRTADALIVVADRDGSIVWVGPSSTRVLGLEPEELRARGIRNLHPASRREVVAVVDRFRRGAADGAQTVTARARHADGSWRDLEATITDRCEDPAVGGIVLTAIDVTDRRRLERELAHRSLHDALTLLPNRAAFVHDLTERLRLLEEGRTVGVLQLELDGFVEVREALGPAVADQVLRAMAARLQRVAGLDDTLARLDGDVLALLTEASDLTAITASADRLLDLVRSEPILIDEEEIRLGASIGIAVAEPIERLRADADAAELLHQAGTAAARAKAAGRGRYVLFDQELQAQSMRRLRLEHDLRLTLGSQGIDVAYQPIVELATGELAGMEALARWSHGRFGRIAPDEFIALAERTGMIHHLGEQVLRTATRDVAALRRRTGLPLTASVNVSALQLSEPGFTDRVRTALSRAELPPPALTLELTESLFIGGDPVQALQLAELRSLGVRIAIDDFGTGYCSLAYLRDLEVDAIKVDRSFVTSIVDCDAGRRLTAGIVELIGSLGLPVVAEGVETEAQRAILQELGCRWGQGYLWSPPVGIGDLEGLLATMLRTPA